MAKATILGSTVKFETELTDNILRKVQAFEPEDLVVTDFNGEPIFRVFAADHIMETSAGEFGAAFYNGQAFGTVRVDDEGEVVDEDLWKIKKILNNINIVEAFTSDFEEPTVDIEIL